MTLITSLFVNIWYLKKYIDKSSVNIMYNLN